MMGLGPRETRMRIAIGLVMLFGVAGCGGSDEPSSPAGGPGNRAGLDPKSMEDLMRNSGGAEGMARAASRPLTAQDVETFIEVFPEYQTAVRAPGGFQAFFSKHGLTADWVMMPSRIMAAAAAARMPGLASSERAKADVEVVRPFLDRLAGASKRK